MFFTRKNDVFINAQDATNLAVELGFIGITYGKVVNMVKFHKLGRKKGRDTKWRISRTLWVSFLLYSPAIGEEGIMREKSRSNVLTFTVDDLKFCGKPRLMKRKFVFPKAKVVDYKNKRRKQAQ